MLLARRWWLVDADERAFLTCDDPVALVAAPHIPSLGVGFRTAALVVLPLSPYRTLVMEGKDTGALSVAPGPRGLIREINRWVAGEQRGRSSTTPSRTRWMASNLIEAG